MIPPVLTKRQGWCLLAILAIAFYLRLVSIGFGLPALNDPDELMFELGALRMLRGPTLDPGWFGHPATTTMYVLALVDLSVFAFAYLLGWAATPAAFGNLIYADPSWFILPGRIVMALFALATIYLTWRIARRFFGPGAGLTAAILLAANPVHITYSQIIRSDMMACAFMLLCLQAAIGIAERGTWRAYLTTAFWLGLAIATKWPFALSGLAIGAATLVAVRDGILSPQRAIVRLIFAGGGAIGFLFVISPYLLIDYPTVLRNLHGEGQAHHLGATGGAFAHNLGWYLSGPIQTGFALPGLLLLVVGTIRLVRHRLALAILAPVAIAFLIVLCAQHLVWERWALPLMPIGAIIAALGFRDVAIYAARFGLGHVLPWVVAGLLIAILLPLGLRTADDDRMRMHDTRQLASAWARRHIPAGSTVLIEHFSFDLISEPWHFLFPMGDAGCIDAVAFLHGKMGYAAIEQARGDRSNLDYGTVAPTGRTSCRADFAILTQSDRYRQERSLFPSEYAAYRTLITSSRSSIVFTPQSGKVGGPTVTILDIRP